MTFGGRTASGTSFSISACSAGPTAKCGSVSRRRSADTSMAPGRSRSRILTVSRPTRPSYATPAGRSRRRLDVLKRKHVSVGSCSTRKAPRRKSLGVLHEPTPLPRADYAARALDLRVEIQCSEGQLGDVGHDQCAEPLVVLKCELNLGVGAFTQSLGHQDEMVPIGTVAERPHRVQDQLAHNGLTLTPLRAARAIV